MTERNKTRWLVALIGVLQVADVVTTNLALRLPGVTEGNHYMAFAQAHLGSAWWLSKVPLMAAMAALFLWWGQPRPVVVAVVLWVAVIGNNLLTLTIG